MKAQKYKATILIVDEDINFGKILSGHLAVSGYEVFVANDVEEIIFFSEKKIDLVILDIMLSMGNSYGIYNELKKNFNVPVIILTALGDKSDCITALEFGVDEYLLKPFSPKELKVRIRSTLRRKNRTNLKANKHLLYFDNLVVDLNKKQIFKGNKQIYLTEIEFGIFELLVANVGKKLSRAYIFENIWGYMPTRYIDTRVIDVHISRLRLKLKDNVNNQCLILTIRGVGYMFQSF